MFSMLPMATRNSSVIGIIWPVWRCGTVVVIAKRPCGHKIQGIGMQGDELHLLFVKIVCDLRMEQGLCIDQLTAGQISKQPDGSIIQTFQW